MEVKIGVHESPKELVLDVDGEPDSVIADLESVIAKEDGMFWITDKKGRRVGVPVERVAYVEISPEAERTVGFGR